MVANLAYMLVINKINPVLRKYIGYLLIILAVLFFPLLFTIILKQEKRFT